MSPSLQNASLVVVEELDNNCVALQTLHLTESECTLSGLWVVDLTEKEKISDISTNKRAIYLGSSKKLKLDVIKTVTITSLAEEGLEQSAKANLKFLEFKKNEPAKRKNLVQPSFFSWNVNVDINHPKSELSRLRKVEEIQGTAAEVQNILTASRLIQIMLQGWIADEIERSSRDYLANQGREFSIIPQCWI